MTVLIFYVELRNTNIPVNIHLTLRLLRYLDTIPCNAPYKEGKGVSMFWRADENIRVTLVWRLFVEVWKCLQICVIKRDAKSLNAQWLSSSGRIHSCLLTMHVSTDGINSWSWKWNIMSENLCNFSLLHCTIWFLFSLKITDQLQSFSLSFMMHHDNLSWGFFQWSL